MDPLLTQIQTLLHREHLLVSGDRVLVACSGGGDSTVLAHLLATLAPIEGFEVVLAHVDHRLRRGSAEDARFVASLAEGLGVEFRGMGVNLELAGGANLEEAAREARYDCLNLMAEQTGATVLALAHHADDQLETVLYRLTKGAALPGLLGIPLTRPQIQGPRLIRPLLETPKAAITRYLGAHGLSWCEDPTNQDQRRPRNRLRHEVAPVLRELNPQLARTLACNLAVLADEERYLAEQAREAFEPAVCRRSPGALAWHQPALAALPVALQRRALGLAWEHVAGSRRGLTHRRLERARHRLAEGLAGPCDLGHGVRVLLEGAIAWLYRPLSPRPAPVPARLDGVPTGPWGARLERVEAGTWHRHPHEAFFDLSLGDQPLEWRLADPVADSFVPFGHRHAHPLGRFLAKAKVPQPLRDRLVVLATGSQVLWIPGLRRSAAAPVVAGAAWALRARCDGRARFDKALAAPYHEGV